MEKDLAQHIQDMANRLSVEKCVQLAFEFPVKNSVNVPENWTRVRKAGREWFLSFKKRRHLSIRTPEATSMARATAFNRHTVSEFFFFFNNISTVMDKYKFRAQDIYNVDESGLTTVQSPKQIVTEMGKKQVGSITSGERGELVTIVCTINAIGNTVPSTIHLPSGAIQGQLPHQGTSSICWVFN
ncbi:hypothetical protein HOLleu_00035 [Holothuria leucospilota]|uniref:Uncharacterized protein n=1 Tax=Holothuria leucospilota TaxID=206669 RepID=A0A9Q1CM56_HOLLE|nr:hypothetical protein HOLleu_00035 [Holothuria leucospilota]